MMEKRQSKRPFGRGLRKILTKWASKSLSSSLSLSSPGPSAVVQQLPNAKSLSSSLASSSPGPSAVVQQLPNELVELILDHLYFDTPTLLNCALVARAWVHRSQRGIFREIILEISTSRTLLTQSFLKAHSVVKNPRLASYVQSLELHRFIEPSSSEAIIGSLHAIAASIVRHLSKLNFLRKLSFVFVIWDTLCPSLKSALTDMLRDASLTQLRLDRVLIPTFAELVSLLSCAAHLKVLNVDRDWNDGWHWHAARALNSSVLQTDFANVGVDARSVGARSILLDELQFESSVWHIDMFLTWFRQDSCPFDIQNLRLLRIGSGAHTSAMLKYAGRNLRELELLESSLNLLAPADTVPLEYTPNLHSLTLYVPQTVTYSPASRIKALLEPLLSPDETRFSLRHLTIKLCLAIENVNPVHWNAWAAFDALLARAEFSLLKTVHIRLAADAGFFYVVPSGIEESFRRTLSYLESSGKLIVQVEE